ncbi:MAG: hypothetical protein AAFR61_15890 [Bacteroidota bacterium]
MNTLANTRILTGLLLASLLGFTACGPTPPTEEELRAQIIGSYCAPEYTLTLEKDRYRNVWATKSPMGTSPYLESCSGNYALNLDGNIWTITYQPADIHKTYKSSDCSRTDTLWSPDLGYHYLGEQRTVMDLFNEKALKKGPCQ